MIFILINLGLALAVTPRSVVTSVFVRFPECIPTHGEASTERTPEAARLPEHTAECSDASSAKTGHNAAGAKHCTSQRHRQTTGTETDTASL